MTGNCFLLALLSPLLVAGYGFACTELSGTSMWASTVAPVLALGGISLFMALVGMAALAPARPHVDHSGAGGSRTR